MHVHPRFNGRFFEVSFAQVLACLCKDAFFGEEGAEGEAAKRRPSRNTEVRHPVAAGKEEARFRKTMAERRREVRHRGGHQWEEVLPPQQSTSSAENGLFRERVASQRDLDESHPGTAVHDALEVLKSKSVDLATPTDGELGTYMATSIIVNAYRAHRGTQSPDAAHPDQREGGRPSAATAATEML
jgi:hypothetical protein